VNRKYFHAEATRAFREKFTPARGAFHPGKVYDVLGWFSPSVIMVKILLQKVWERKIVWDDEGTTRHT
jgi:hypothetical protein